MTKYKINLFAAVKTQIKEISAYIREQLHSPQSAKNVTLEIKSAIASLKTMPERITLVREEPWRSKGIRRMMAGNYAIYLWIDDVNRRVSIIAVLYGKRDQAARLLEMIFP